MNAQDVANTLYDAHYVMDGEPTETTYRALKALGVEHDEALRLALQPQQRQREVLIMFGQCECGQPVKIVQGVNYNDVTMKRHVCGHDFGYAVFDDYDEIWGYADKWKASKVYTFWSSTTHRWVAKYFF